ncbi:hypothetical protein GCM10025734_70460 [Kitasatospora paranensis]
MLRGRSWQNDVRSSDVQRTPGSVKIRTGGYSPRPVRSQRPVDQVKFLDRRLKSGWEACAADECVRGPTRAAVCRWIGGLCPGEGAVAGVRRCAVVRVISLAAPESAP